MSGDDDDDDDDDYDDDGDDDDDDGDDDDDDDDDDDKLRSVPFHTQFFCLSVPAINLRNLKEYNILFLTLFFLNKMSYF